MFKVFLILNKILIRGLYRIVQGIKIQIRDLIDVYGFSCF